MSVFAPSGSGNVHIDRIMGGKKVPPKKKGMGFNAAAAAAGRSSGKGPKAGAAMVAAASRNASPTAKKANPNLKKVAAPKTGAKKPAMAKKATGAKKAGGRKRA
jgi:hypothetical protein